MSAEWDRVSRAYDGKNPPPPWPLSRDPRRPECEHLWTATWGRKGECQRRCTRCRRWIWDHDWTMDRLADPDLPWGTAEDVAGYFRDQEGDEA